MATIESIENEYWGSPEYDSYLVETIHKLRKKNIDEFTAEDLRIMIGQKCSLPIVIPLAIKKLEKNILKSGHFYDGDLLQYVLESSPEYWAENLDVKDSFKKVFVKNRKKIKGSTLHERFKAKLITAYEQFVNGAKVTAFN